MELTPTVRLPHCTGEYVQNIQTFSAKVWKRPGCVYMHRVPNLSFSLRFESEILGTQLLCCCHITAEVIILVAELKTVKLLTTQQLLIHMFTYVSVFPPHEACKSLSYMSVTFQWGLVITATTFQHHLGQRSTQLEGIPSGFCSTDRSGWLMSLRFKATSSLRFHCSINWVLVPLCM